MAPPHPPNPAVGADGAQHVQPGPNEPRTQEYPDNFTGNEQPIFVATQPDDATGLPTAYPGQQWPAGSYPKRRTKKLLIGTLVAVTVIAALTAAIMYGVRTNGANTGVAFSEKSARTAVQGYLDALEDRDIETIARNALCGIYDGVRDRHSDRALAKLNSDAFRRQYSQAEVITVDKIVYWSQYQAQALFTMQVAPATGGPQRAQLQGIAQLLFQRNQILVCSYVLRPATTY